MKIQQRRYFSYLLRMWQVEEAGRLVWRASLEDPHDGQVVFFPSLSHLFRFIENEGDAPEDGHSFPKKKDNDLPGSRTG